MSADDRSIAAPFPSGRIVAAVSAPDRPLPDTDGRLDSWKEIAAYLGRTERTVRRWEDSLGLPVHRLAHEKRSSVYAYRSELDSWRQSRERIEDPGDEAPGTDTESTAPAPAHPIRPPVRYRRVAALIALAVVLAAGGLWLVRGARRAAQAGPRSVAVLPFENLSRDPQQEWFSSGMTEMLTTELSKIRSLKVTSHASVVSYNRAGKTVGQIGRDLGADAVVEGSALQVDGKVRITAQLVSTGTDSHIWSRAFDGGMDDVLTLQRDVALAIAQEVGAELTSGDRQRLGGARRVDPQAMSNYLSALNLYRRNQFTQAAELARKAVQIDPDFAAAHELIGITLETMADDHRARYADIIPEAQAELQRALALEPDRGAATGWLGATYFFGRHDWGKAEPYLRRAFALDPASGNNLGLFLSAQGKYAEAVAVVDQTVAADPFNPDLLADAARVYEFARRYDESARLYQKASDLNPGGGYAYYFMPISLILGGHPDEAFEHFMLTRDGRGPLGRGPEFRRLYEKDGWTAVWQAWLDGRPPGSLDVFSRWARILLRRDSETLDMLEQLEQQNDSWMLQLEDPVYDPLRHEPRFTAILKRVGYPSNMIPQ
jgi:TolB-like protein/Flp pilus assembly protein TadD